MNGPEIVVNKLFVAAAMRPQRWAKFSIPGDWKGAGYGASELGEHAAPSAHFFKTKSSIMR